MDRIYEKLEKIDEHLDGIHVLQAIHTEQLKEHMRRSDLLEKRIEQVDTELKPVERHVAMVNGAIKLIGILGTVAAIALAIMRMM